MQYMYMNTAGTGVCLVMYYIINHIWDSYIIAGHCMAGLSNANWALATLALT